MGWQNLLGTELIFVPHSHPKSMRKPGYIYPGFLVFLKVKLDLSEDKRRVTESALTL